MLLIFKDGATKRRKGWIFHFSFFTVREKERCRFLLEILLKGISHNLGPSTSVFSWKMAKKKGREVSSKGKVRRANVKVVL